MELAILSGQLLASLKLLAILVTIILAPLTIVGLLFSVLQAAMQLNDNSISFLPKTVVVVASIFFSWRVFSQELVELCLEVFRIAGSFS